MDPITDLIDDSVGKDRVARKHIRILEEAWNRYVQQETVDKQPGESPAMTKGLGEMKRFTVSTSAKNSTAQVMPPSDIPPSGTVEDYDPEGGFVKIRDRSESGWMKIKRDYVNEFCEQMGITPVWPKVDSE